MDGRVRCGWEGEVWMGRCGVNGSVRCGWEDEVWE